MAETIETYKTVTQNGGATKYIVTNYVDSKYVMVTKQNKNLVTKFEYEQIWSGNADGWGNKLKYGDREYGHVVLLQLKDEPTKYVFIQDEITLFEAGKIDTFYSYVGNSAVVASYARDQEYYYFFQLKKEGVVKFPISKIASLPENEIVPEDYYTAMYDIPRTEFDSFINEGISM